MTADNIIAFSQIRLTLLIPVGTPHQFGEAPAEQDPRTLRQLMILFTSFFVTRVHNNGCRLPFTEPGHDRMSTTNPAWARSLCLQRAPNVWAVLVCLVMTRYRRKKEIASFGYYERVLNCSE